MSGSDEDLLVASWTERPFTSHRRRSVTVEHRILLDAYPGVGVDLRHEVRCDDYGPGDGWVLAEAYEVREHGVDRVRPNGEWWT